MEKKIGFLVPKFEFGADLLCNRQPLFVFCDGAVPGTSGDQSQWVEGVVRAVVWAKYADQDD